jgi:hypothetical protein
MTAPQTPLSVRYHPILWWAFLVLGALNLVLGLWLLALGIPMFSLLLGVLFLVLGALYRARPHFVYVPRTQTIEVVAPLGTRRLYSAERGGALVADGASFYRTGADGRRKRVPVYRYMSRRPEWNAVAAAIGTGR